jgi:hypothetical protein
MLRFGRSWARRRVAADDAQWQHAAVYIGEGYVVEATLHGVRYAPIFPYLGGHRLRLRRPLDLSDDDRWKIAIQACVRSNERYAMRSILRLFRLSFGGYWTRQRGFAIAYAKSVICSQLYADAYSRVTGRLVTPPVAGIPTPAALSASTAFEDVDLSWAIIPH